MTFKREQVTAKTTELGNTLDIQKHHALQQSFDSIGNTAQKANTLANEHSTLGTIASFAPQIGTGVGAAGAGWMGARWMASRAMPAMAETAAVSSPSLAANASVAFSRLTGTISGLATRATAVIGQTPQVLSNLTARATGVIARTPTLLSNATRTVVPYAQAAAPWLARAAGVIGAGYTGWQIGSAANPYINKAVSKATGRENTLGTSIYGFFNDDKANKLATGAAIPRVSAGVALGGKDANGGAAGALTAAIAKLTGNESGLSSAISQLMSWQPNPLPVEVNTQSHLTVSLAAGLVAQAQSSQSSSTAPKGANTSKVNTGNIWSGAPS